MFGVVHKPEINIRKEVEDLKKYINAMVWADIEKCVIESISGNVYRITVWVLVFQEIKWS